MTRSHKKELEELVDDVAFFNRADLSDLFGDYTLGELEFMYRRRPMAQLRHAINIAKQRRHDWLDRAHRGLCWLAREVL